MPTKTPSPLHQVNELFKDFLAIGESRHEAKLDMIGHGIQPQAMGDKIHSWASFKKESQGAINFARWCKAEHGMKYLADIKPGWTREYIDLRKASVSPNTAAADLTAIRRLDKCMQAKGWTKDSIVPADVKAPRGGDGRGAYEPSQVQAIIADVSKRNPLAGDVLRVQFSGGLRLREAITVRSELIDLRRGIVPVIGKGGKPRSVELHDRRVLDRLDLREKFPLRPGPGDNGSKLTEQGWMRRIQAHVRTACKRLGITPRGTHAIRACAAQIHYKSLVVRGQTKREALGATAQWLGHGPDRFGVLKRYLGEALVNDALAE